MKALDKIIERYNGVHRHSIVSYDVQEIYEIIINNIFCDKNQKPIIYYCECLKTKIYIYAEFKDINFVQCYGDIENITIIIPIKNNTIQKTLNDCEMGFQASLYCLLLDLLKDKTYKLNKHTYKNLEDKFDENSLEDLHDLATLLLNTPYKELIKNPSPCPILCKKYYENNFFYSL